MMMMKLINVLLICALLLVGALDLSRAAALAGQHLDDPRPLDPAEIEEGAALDASAEPELRRKSELHPSPDGETIEAEPSEFALTSDKEYEDGFDYGDEDAMQTKPVHPRY